MGSLTAEQAFQIAVGHHQRGQFDQAQGIYQQILTVQPSHVGALVNLASIAQAQGQFQDAVQLLTRAVAVQPTFAEAHNNLGNALKDQGKLDQAIAAYQRAIELKPHLPEAFNNLGNALKDDRQLRESIVAYRRAIALRPRYPEAYNNLGNALASDGQPEEAMRAHRDALALDPAYGQAWSNLGNVLKNLGRLEEALVAYRRALELLPGDSQAHSNLLYALQYDPLGNPASIAGEHFTWDRRHAQPLAELSQPLSNDCTPHRRLRIGYVSADFHQHSVAYFLENLLLHHDRAAVEVYCYADVLHPDDTTARLQRCADHWRPIAGRSDAHVAQQIREDRIDILIDLAGHTANNRLLVFARKPAPVQVSYLGYPGTTGLTAMDYRLTDAQADPPGLTEALYREQLVRLPLPFLSYRPAASPPVTPPPSAAAGFLTFGSFNALAKINEPLIETWSRLLREVPRSRLILKSVLPGAAAAAGTRFLQAFANQGVDAGRIEILGRIDRHVDHLQAYGGIDIALDTFPYHGTTTTCEALWMGVPVITLAGPAHVSRVGVSLLWAVGLPELIATSTQEYVQNAAALGRDASRLSALRATLRAHMQQSPLMDGEAFARKVETALIAMWERWCGGKDPAAPGGRNNYH